MAKIDLDALNIDELAALRDRAIEKLAEKVAARQAELEAELERLSQYGKAGKKLPSAPTTTRGRKAKAGEEAASPEQPGGSGEVAEAA